VSKLAVAPEGFSSPVAPALGVGVGEGLGDGDGEGVGVEDPEPDVVPTEPDPPSPQLAKMKVEHKRRIDRLSNIFFALFFWS